MIPVERKDDPKRSARSKEEAKREEREEGKEDELERLSENKRFHVVHLLRFRLPHVRNGRESVFDESCVGPAVERERNETKRNGDEGSSGRGRRKEEEEKSAYG